MTSHRLTRRSFLTHTAAGLTLPVWAGRFASAAAQSPAGAGSSAAVDLAEWSYFWLGVERAPLARGTVVNGEEFFVEYAIPRQLRHPWPVVLVHGGTGQGTEWMTTPDGRPGWATVLLQEGYAVYVLDRPGQGRSPFHPYLHGNFAAAPTFEEAAAQLSLAPTDPAVAQFVAAQGVAPGGAARMRDAWRTRGAMLLDEIGPAIIVTQGERRDYADLVAQSRPGLVKGIVTVAPPATPAPAGAGAATPPTSVPTLVVRGNTAHPAIARDSRETLQTVLDWFASSGLDAGTPVPRGATSRPVNPQPGDSTAMNLADQGTFWVGVQQKTVGGATIPFGQMFVQYFVPAARRHPYPIVLVHGGGGQSTHFMGIGRRPGFLHFLLQEGYAVYLVDRPGFGRSPYHPDALGPSHLNLFPAYEVFAQSPAVMNTVRWPGSHVIGEDPLVDQFMANEVSNVTDEAFHSELCERGGVELLDRIGPCLLMGHAFGGFLTWILADRRPALVKGIVNIEINGNPFTRQFRWGLTAIPLTYEPPVSDPSEFRLVEVPLPSDSPRPITPTYTVQAEPARQLKNLKGIPIAWMTGEFGGGGNGIAQVAFLTQAGCSAELLRLRDLGIPDNGNLMPMETNNREVFDVIRTWLDRKVV